jgi:trehalose synthase
VIEVQVPELDPRRLTPLVGESRIARLAETAVHVREHLDGRRVLNVNSTATGGGVAETLLPLLGYVRHEGIDARWLVISGDVEFFAVTKRIHNGLYGGDGDGLELDHRARDTYERALAENEASLHEVLRRGDVVIVHDPQPAGLVPRLRELGAHVIWRCHVGLEAPNEWSERAWEFIRPYVEPADAFVFSRSTFAPAWIEPDRVSVIPPSIDPFAPKNVDLEPGEGPALLGAAGLIAYDRAEPTRARPARIVRAGAPPSPAVPLVVQVSRWDRMKDMGGVLNGFVQGVGRSTGARLLLAGPDVDGVDDDPEARLVWDETVAAWQRLPAKDRERVDLAALSMTDVTENALVVNALQRHAAVVVQKSLAEGFGLTVAEAMIKSRPVVASAVGGIADQVVDGETGLLHEPGDLESFGRLVTSLLERPADAARLGENARQRVIDYFLGDRPLLQYAALLDTILAG